MWKNINFNKILDNKEFVIVILVIFVIMMMVIPLPTQIMDLIIAFNISITVLVLMVVIYMQSPLALTAFPSILLVLALLRIGITVSTSRLILLNANAGEFINTFGEFVVGGNLIVGVIIFVIITLINFIVITKGSERVAEVAARFSLDAMPGKQMSIDSDLRANNITMEQASKKRKDLGLESKLYGAMDGAMKFVKGDAIASIIDIIINLVGGLIVGMIQHGLSFGDALQTYSILTVGDGLVQQVPALLISLTAGMMITRVSDDTDENNLGQNILSQIFRDYKAIFSACILMVILALIPGMPSSVFVALLILFGGIGFYLRRKTLRGETSTPGTKAKGTSIVEDSTIDADEDKPLEVASLQLSPLVLYLAPNLKNSNNLKMIKQILGSIQQQIMNELGVIIPQIIIRYNSSLKDNQFELLVFEIPASNGTIYWDRILLIDDEPKFLAGLGITEPNKNTLKFGEKNLGSWINSDKKTECDEYQLRYLTCQEMLQLHLRTILSYHTSEFLGIQEVKNLLDQQPDYQDLIRELMRMIPLNKVTEILQRLVNEGISIRNFKVILDAMLEWSQREKEVVIITEYVRKALGRYIAYKYSNGTYLIPCLLLSYKIEDMVRDAIRYANNGSYLALDPKVNQQIISLVKKQLEDNATVKNTAIITQLDIRRYVRSIIEKEIPYLPVLSYQELDGFAEFNTVGVIELGDDFEGFDDDDDDEDL